MLLQGWDRVLKHSRSQLTLVELNWIYMSRNSFPKDPLSLIIPGPPPRTLLPLYTTNPKSHLPHDPVQGPLLLQKVFPTTPALSELFVS